MIFIFSYELQSYKIGNHGQQFRNQYLLSKIDNIEGIGD
jgi:hypothetical protein